MTLFIRTKFEFFDKTVADFISHEYIISIIKLRDDETHASDATVSRRNIRSCTMDDDFKKLTVELDGLKIKQEAIAHNTEKTAEKLESIEKTLQAIYELLKTK